MFNTVKRIAVGLAALSISVGAFAQSDRAMDLDALLKQLEEGQFAQSQQNKQRERDFQAQRAEQDRILRETREKRDQMLAQSEQLETQFEENEFKLADLNGALDTRLGSLKELFGVLQQIAGDTKNKFYNSVVSAQIPGRADFLDKMAQDMGSSSKLASIEEIERVWFEMQREMTLCLHISFQRLFSNMLGFEKQTECHLLPIFLILVMHCSIHILISYMFKYKLL